MNLFKRNQTPKKAATPVAKPLANTTSKKGSFDTRQILAKAKKTEQKLASHLSFVAILLVLVVYMFVVWQIRGLVTAEPSPEAESSALTSTNIPKIDEEAIDNIESLEQNSPQVRALFDEARNNPFHE